MTCKQCRLVFPDIELLEGHTCSKETAPDSVPLGDVDGDNDGADLEKKNDHSSATFVVAVTVTLVAC